MKYSDAQRIDKMRVTAEKLLTYLSEQHITREQVLEEELIRWTITTPLYNVGEHAYNLSDEFKSAYPEVPWAKISGLRHRLVHDYENTNWSLICTIIYEVLPEFLQSLIQIQNQLRE